jgi:outer membrane protein OmpA-like peptidoglycan-associated protein
VAYDFGPIIAGELDGGFVGMTALYAKATATLGFAALIFTGTGCATKKHVRQTVAPVEARVTQAEQRNAEQQAALGELENSVSRVDERAMDAERKAREAGQAAQQAGQAAQQAGNAAQVAHNRADTAHQLAESTRSRLTELSENIDNYQLVTTESVLFGLNRFQLTKEHKQQLDQAVAELQGSKNFVLEIQGSADATGAAAANLELSRKRADDSVVRYLTVQHNVPLRRINVLGVGEEDPNADNKTREGRRMARRVDIRVYSRDLSGNTTAANTGAQPNTPPTQ